MQNLYLDFETHSAVQISRGLDQYMRGAKPTLLTWALDDAPVQLHDFTVEPKLPAPLLHTLLDQNVMLIAHNANFDRLVFQMCLKLNLGIDRWFCTQAAAYSHSLPGGLAPLGGVLGLPTDKQKLADGMRLMRKFCGPKPLKKDHEWGAFKEYAIRDTEALREVYKVLPKWNCRPGHPELALWHTDQVINQRGFAIDAEFAEAAVKALKKAKDELDDDAGLISGATVMAATQRDKLLTWLCESQGVMLPDLKAATVKAALEDDTLDSATRHMLMVRQQSAKTSTAKFKQMLSSAGPDGRLRGTLAFAGASRTARWAGRIFQPQNLPRPTMKSDDIRHCIQLVKQERTDLIPIFTDNVSVACSNALRGLIVAAPGKKLVAADWSNIEGRGIAWLANEEWKIKAFYDLDAGRGEDLYKLIFSKSFNVPVQDVTGFQRQQGKGMELSMGYGGGVGAFLNIAASYGLDLEELGRTVPAVAPPEIIEKAHGTWKWAVDEDRTFGLDQDVYVACETLKRLYRQINPNIASYWYMLENAAKSVIQDRGYPMQVGHCVFDYDGKWMRIKLPSGRFLCYPLPKVSRNGTITYMAWQNRRWSRIKTYGGKISENITQAVARDFLAHSLPLVEAEKLPVVLHVHDEIVAEVPESDTGALDRLTRIMETNPPWAKGFPLAAAGFETDRYEKG